MGSQSKARHFSIASVDTIRLTTEQPLRTAEAMLALGFKPCKRRKWQGYVLDLPPFKFRWSLHNYLSVEVSLPRYLHGSNIYTLESDEEINEALCKLSHDVSTLLGFDFNAHETLLTRVDYAVNLYCANNKQVREILAAMPNALISRMKYHKHKNKPTVYFNNKSRQICIYDKYDAMRNQLKRGSATVEQLNKAIAMLRLELRFRKGRSCRNLFKRLRLPDRKAKTLLTIDIATLMLGEVISALNLDKPIVFRDERLALLRERFGASTYLKLFRFITDCEVHGIEQVKNTMPYSTFRKRYNLLREAGLAIACSGRRTHAPIELSKLSKKRPL
jgi:hypothetical protein